MRNFRNYEVWNSSINYTVKLYSVLKDYPDTEKFNLISQMQKSAVSIPSNIAEGASRSSDKEFKRFLEIALGSSFELETQLIISNRLKYINSEIFEDLNRDLDLLQKRLNSLRSKL